MGNNLVSVIIPNYNGLRFLPFCLNSLKNQTYNPIEVIVVDNCSQDDSIKFIKEKCPQVHILTLDKNYGFASAVNKGIKRAKGNYIALLNNDAIADKDWISELVKPMENDLSIGITTSLMKLSKKRRSLIDGAGDIMSTYGGPYKRGFYKKDKGQYNRSEFIFGGCGGASLYRKELFEKIGYFDEDFFAYFEDVDLSFRARLAGWKCFYVHSSLVYHYHRGTSRRNLRQYTYLNTRNLDTMILKNMPTKLLFKYWHQHLFNYIFYIKIMLINMYYLPQMIKGKIDVLLSLKEIMRKRKEIQSTKKISDEELDKLLSRDLEDEEKINDITNFVSMIILCIISSFYINILLLILFLVLYCIISRIRKDIMNFIRRRYYYWGKDNISYLDRISDFVLGNGLLLVVIYYIFSFPVFIYVILSFMVLREIIRVLCKWSFSK